MKLIDKKQDLSKTYLMISFQEIYRNKKQSTKQ